jgi:CBS domain-containing protein
MDEEILDEEFSLMYEEAARVRTLDSETFRLPVKHLKLRKPVTLEGVQTLQEAITFMQLKQFGCVLITKNEKLAGILTERDIIARALAEGKNPERTQINEIMTPNPESVQPDDSIAYVMNAMHVGGYRHVPVVDEQNVPLAVISVKDVVGFIVENFSQEILNLPPHPLRSAAGQDGG